MSNLVREHPDQNMQNCIPPSEKVESLEYFTGLRCGRFGFKVDNTQWICDRVYRKQVSVRARLWDMFDADHPLTLLGYLFVHVDCGEMTVKIYTEVNLFRVFETPEMKNATGQGYSIYEYNPSDSFEEAKQIFIRYVKENFGQNWKYVERGNKGERE